jgi:sugar lactone lactonase YvrE
MVGSQPYGIFVNTNNTIHVAEYNSNRIQVWLEGSINPTRTISGNIIYPVSLFVTSSGDIYVDNGYYYGEVDRWLLNATNSIPAMYIPQSCNGLFIDINNTLYCSLGYLHQVVAKSLDDISNTFKITAGTGCYGSASNMLYYPQGIYVDINFNLYVADFINSRIQLFQSGQLNGTTVALGTISLSNPTSVVLDADGYLFIVDYGNSRIIGSGPAGFRCVAGCSGASGSASNQLSNPQTMAFDSYGNIFVTDVDNSRIQKFVLAAHSCGMYHLIL